jgi:hypothetical protein
LPTTGFIGSSLGGSRQGEAQGQPKEPFFHHCHLISGKKPNAQKYAKTSI